jgi:hypothetical protein
MCCVHRQDHILVQHDTCPIREYAVFRNNCITFNAMQLEDSADSLPLCSNSNVTPNFNWVETLVKLDPNGILNPDEVNLFRKSEAIVEKRNQENASACR